MGFIYGWSCSVKLSQDPNGLFVFFLIFKGGGMKGGTAKGWRGDAGGDGGKMVGIGVGGWGGGLYIWLLMGPEGPKLYGFLEYEPGGDM